MGNAVISLCATLAEAQIRDFVTPPSTMAAVDVMPLALAMTIAEALTIVLAGLPRTPDLDVVAMGDPAQLEAVAKLHAARAVLQALVRDGEAA